MEPSAPGRLRRVERCMGTVFSFDIRGAGVSDETLSAVVNWLHRMDAMFSTYRSDSEISRLNAGTLTVPSCSPEVHEVLDLDAGIRRASGGYFDTRCGRQLDLSGLVKGWAIEKASSMLQDAGSTAHAINGGGDIQLVGEAGAGRPWTIGIADPFRRGALATTVSGTDMAIATSSTAERGCHVINPLTGQPATDLASITLTGRHLTEVDAYATAAFAMGTRAREWIDGVAGVEAFAITADGGTWRTSGFPR